jgi:hypothetical protein
MSLLQKYEALKYSAEYNKYQLDCIKDYFIDNKIKINNRFKCNGKGECYTNIPGTYILYKFSNNCDCKLKKCPNFILCETYVSEGSLDEYYGLCYQCSIAYKLCGKGKGILQVFDSKQCTNCNKNTKCIEQSYCDHILCLECFNLAHMKPGNDKCPICDISRDTS